MAAPAVPASFVPNMPPGTNFVTSSKLTPVSAQPVTPLSITPRENIFSSSINDDTIAGPNLLAQHLDLHHAHSTEKLAILGNFKLPEAAKNRVLTWFLSTQPFLFPQVGLKPGIYTNHSFFITCNVSVRRDLVLTVGSFDPDFRVAEDTELGIRLIQKGLKILYTPESSNRSTSISISQSPISFAAPKSMETSWFNCSRSIRIFSRRAKASSDRSTLTP
jgi:hypothetical protein